MKLTAWTLKNQHSQTIFSLKIIKYYLKSFIIKLQNFSKCIIDRKFPDQLKKKDVSPVFKKGNNNDKTNYRPVSILPSLSKIYESLIHN